MQDHPARAANSGIDANGALQAGGGMPSVSAGPTSGPVQPSARTGALELRSERDRHGWREMSKYTEAMPSLNPRRSAAQLRAIANRSPEIANDLRELADDLDAKRGNLIGGSVRQRLSTYRLVLQSPFGRLYRVLKDSVIRN